MSNEADSRHTTTRPRWGETAAQVPDAGTVEPPSGKKDTGWSLGDVPNRSWWNWLHWAASVFFRYIENFLALGLTRNHVMAGAANTEGLITNGAALSVNVSFARCWIAGGMYKVPAAVNLALAAADPTDARADLIYAHLSGGSPVFAVVTGTPSATLPLPVPATPAGGCPIGTARVAAAAVVPSAITSLREFGALSLDRIIVTNRFDGGIVGGVPIFQVFSDTGLENGAFFGDNADPLLQANVDLDYLALDPERFTFFTSIVRKYDMPASIFRKVTDVAGNTTDLNNIANGGAWTFDGTSFQWLQGPVQIPNGGIITAFRVRGNRADNTRGLIVEFWKINKTTNAKTMIGSVVNPLGSGGSGNFTLSVTGLSEAVDQTCTYVMEIDGRGGNPSDMWNAEVEYTELNPFDGL